MLLQWLKISHLVYKRNPCPTKGKFYKSGMVDAYVIINLLSSSFIIINRYLLVL